VADIEKSKEKKKKNAEAFFSNEEEGQEEERRRNISGWLKTEEKRNAGGGQREKLERSLWPGRNNEENQTLKIKCETQPLKAESMKESSAQ